MLLATMAKLHKLRFELLHHPPYLLDLDPSDYQYLFADLKRMLQGKTFVANAEVIATNAYFVSKDKSFYEKGIKMLE